MNVQERSLPRILVIDREQRLFTILSRSLHHQANIIMSSSSSYEEFFTSNTLAAVALPEYVAVVISSNSIMSLKNKNENIVLRRPQYRIHHGAFVDTCFVAVFAPEAAQQPFLRDMLFNEMGVNMVHKVSSIFSLLFLKLTSILITHVSFHRLHIRKKIFEGRYSLRSLPQ